jgi:hypothetical protein
MNCVNCAKNAFRAMAASANTSRPDVESPCSVEQGLRLHSKISRCLRIRTLTMGSGHIRVYYFSVLYNLAQHKALYYIYYCTVYT